MYKLILFFSIIPMSLFPGNDDSLKVSNNKSFTKFFYANQFEFSDSISEVEGSLLNFQNYIGRTNLGNSGLPFNSIYFNSLPVQTGFNYCRNNYQDYFFSPYTLKFYNTRTPYTDLLYIIGSKKEQNFKMTFSYNIKKKWNVTADFSRIRSDGFYLRQQTYDNFLAVSSNYKSPNNRYFLLSSVIYNNAKNNENGGVTHDSILEMSGTNDRTLIPVNLLAAKQNTLNRSFFLRHYFNFGNKSTDTAAHNEIIPGSRLILTSLIEDNSMKYEDANPLSGYYSKIYYDSTQTFDSAYNLKIENELAWKRVDNKKHRGLKDMIGAGFSVNDQYVKIRQREIDTSFNNIILGTEFYNTYSNTKFCWKFSGKYVLTGYNENDYSASLVLKKNIVDSLNVLALNLGTREQEADFIFSRYSSNHFKWSNTYDKTHKDGMGINFSMKKYALSFGADFSMYSHVLYFDKFAISRQYRSSIPLFTAFLKKKFNFHNWHLNNKIDYQYVPEWTVIKVPEFIFDHSLYYEKDVFKGAMRLQIGASLFYTSAYYANAYMPATKEFYLQDQKKYGDYPVIDFYVNARIQTVRIFIKIDHLNSGLTGQNYFLTPHYPINDRAFKLGISWRFFD